MDLLEKLRILVVEGSAEEAVSAAKALLETETKAKEIVDGLTLEMQRLGERFERFEVFLPELVVAADAFLSVMEILKPKLEAELSGTGIKERPTIVLGTVKGDYHEIGKTVVGLVMQANGFDVIDLGADVDPVTFMDEAKRHKAALVGLSALMTTTMPAQEEFIKLLKEAKMEGQFKVMVGGAPTSLEHAKRIGADGWAFDAFGAVVEAKRLLGMKG